MTTTQNRIEIQNRIDEARAFLERQGVKNLEFREIKPRIIDDWGYIIRFKSKSKICWYYVFIDDNGVYRVE